MTGRSDLHDGTRQGDGRKLWATPTGRLVLAGMIGVFVLGIMLLLAGTNSAKVLDDAAIGAEIQRANAAINAVLADGAVPDATAAARIQTQFLLANARFAPLTTLATGDVAVQVPAHPDMVMVWTPRMLGSQTFDRVAPVRITLILGMLTLLSGILISFHRLARKLDARRVEATALAGRDALTGLANRLTFEQCLEAHCAAQVTAPLALYYLDLDNFKPVNDQLGHAAGDQLLKLVAQRLSALVGAGDMVVRLGGDEFAILKFSDLSRGALADFAHTIHSRLTAPFDIDGRPVSIGVSMGIAMLPEHANVPGTLVTAADAALYRAKARSDAFFLFAATPPTPVRAHATPNAA